MGLKAPLQVVARPNPDILEAPCGGLLAATIDGEWCVIGHGLVVNKEGRVCITHGIWQPYRCPACNNVLAKHTGLEPHVWGNKGDRQFDDWLRDEAQRMAHERKQDAGAQEAKPE